MSIVKINLINKNFQLYSNSGQEGDLIELATRLNARMSEIKIVNPSAPFELILVMAALANEEELAHLKLKLEPHQTLESKSAENEESFETLTTIAKYLENLAKKLGK